MTDKVKKSIFVRLRNYFITGAIVLIPIGITIYLTLFIIKLSSTPAVKELLNPPPSTISAILFFLFLILSIC